MATIPPARGCGNQINELLEHLSVNGADVQCVLRHPRLAWKGLLEVCGSKSWPDVFPLGGTLGAFLGHSKGFAIPLRAKELRPRIWLETPALICEGLLRAVPCVLSSHSPTLGWFLFLVR